MFINYETYVKIEITKKGEDLSKKILEAYDIVFVFLKDVLGLKTEEAEEEAEKLKGAVSDNTLNELAKYVHKVLDFNSLDCGYDINKEKCRACARRKIKKDKV